MGLKGGLYDSKTAASGLEMLLTLPKPAGFDPDPNYVPAGPPGSPAPAPPPGPPQPVRGQYGSTNSDLAFEGKTMFVGNYNGINFYDISKPAQVKLITSLLCPGGQGDVSVYGHLLFMSVEAGNGRLDCGVQGIALPAGYVPPAPPPPPADGSAPRRVRPPDLPSPDRFKGVRVFDISDMTHPKQVAAVQTCRGSHTHTLLVDPKDKDNVYIYISGSAPVRPKDELTGCSGADPTLDPETALFTIVVIKVPVAHPELAKIVASPRIFTDETSGKMNGLMNAPVHGEGAARATVGCHDITVFESMGLAAGACSGNGILLDIRDPVHPKRLDAVNDPNYAFWHSANFANDGSKVLFTDEWGGGGQARCRAEDPMNWGADAIFKLNGKTDKLTLQSYYKMPAPQTDKENCVAHNGSLVPIPGRDILVQSWYQGGVSMVDFTDAGHPVEIGYFDRGPINDDKFSMGGQWSTYYYNGYIYGSEIARGVDVFKLVPNKFLTQNEIDAAALVHLNELNVQNQPKLTWPQNFTVAKAYLDQLARGTSVPADKVAAMNAAIEKAEASHSKKDMGQLKTMAAGLDKDAASATSPADAERMHALAKIMMAPGV